MKIIVAIVVYNRFQNIKRWVECWRQCNTKDAELVIIHNYYNDQGELNKYKKYCDDNGVTYVPRNGTGYDIGAFMDVCKQRLPGFPDYDFLLWVTDDVFSMTKDFITPFIKKLQEPGVGVSCMQLSKSVSPHIRTTGFMIKKETALKLKFPADPMTTKQHCYFFEHRGGANTFTNQIRQMGLSCQAVAPIKTSPLWDSQHPNLNYRTDRQEEFNKVWGIKTSDKVVFISPIFDAFPEIISSLICQSNKNWELLLIDDNPEETICKTIVEAVNDARIKYIKRERAANYGHPHRQWALNELKEDRLSQDVGFVVVTNADNFYTPNFISDMLKGFKSQTIATYSQKMVHSYRNWDVINCRLERGYLDCGGVMVRKDIACDIGWQDTTSHSSDWSYFADIIKQHGVTGFVPVPGALFTHNVIIFFIFISLITTIV